MPATAPATLDYAARLANAPAPRWPWILPCVLCAGVYFAIPRFHSGVVGARAAAARTDVNHLRAALTGFKNDTGRYPTVAEGLAALVTPPPRLPAWRGPYLRRLSPDPWGQPYHYTLAAGTASPQVLSLGPDGSQGTPNDIVSAVP